MLENELIFLIKKIISEKTEKSNLEIKKAANGIPKRLYDTLSSFSNQDGGGTIVFGIDEESDYEVTGVYDAQDLQKKLMEQSLQMEPVVRPLITIAEYEGKMVVSAEVAECDITEKPCFYKGAGRLKGSYIRVGESDQPMTEYEIYSYEVYKKRLHDELEIVSRGSMEDLYQLALDEYRNKLMYLKPNLVNLSKEKVFDTQGVTLNGQVTKTGMLLFASYPQQFFPQLSITGTVIPGYEIGDTSDDGTRFLDNIRIEGRIEQMLESGMAFVRRNSKVSTLIDDNGVRRDKTEYPMKAVREILLNALVHRDYSIHTEGTPIRITMFRDRMEIENPGGLYGRITLNQLGKVASDTRNPFMAGILEVMEITENRYSGIPTIYKEMEKAGLRKPIFVNERGMFKVVLYSGKTNQNQLADTNGGGYRTTEEEILLFCREPKSKDELAKHFQFDSQTYFVNTYVKPLVKKGLIAMTLPEKPKSKFQKYITRLESK